MSLYHSQRERLSDTLIANSTKIFSKIDGKLVPATEYEKVLFNQDRVEAMVRLSIDASMTAK